MYVNFLQNTLVLRSFDLLLHLVGVAKYYERDKV